MVYDLPSPVLEAIDEEEESDSVSSLEYSDIADGWMIENIPMID